MVLELINYIEQDGYILVYSLRQIRVEDHVIHNLHKVASKHFLDERRAPRALLRLYIP